MQSASAFGASVQRYSGDLGWHRRGRVRQRHIRRRHHSGELYEDRGGAPAEQLPLAGQEHPVEHAAPGGRIGIGRFRQRVCGYGQRMGGDEA